MVNKLLNSVGNGLSFFKKVLKSILTADGSESGIGYFSYWLHDVLNSVICSFGVNDSIIDAGINIDSDIIFGKNKLTIQVNYAEITEISYMVFRFTAWMT